MASGRPWSAWAAAVGAVLLLATPPAPAEAQDRFPSIRIGGGQVRIGGQHVGFTGRGGNRHATGILIRNRLHRLGDPRAHFFGPGRIGGLHHLRLHHPLHPLHPHHPHHPLHHGHGHLIVVAFHPLGSVGLAGRLVQTSTVGGDAGVGHGAGIGHGAAPTVSSEPAAPLPPDRCADVTVHMLAGVVQTVRVDLRGLGVRTPEEAEELLRGRAASGEVLELRGAYGGGLTAPESVVREVAVEACPAPRDDSER